MSHELIKKIGSEDEYLITDKIGRIPSLENIEGLFNSLQEIGWEKEDNKHIYRKNDFIIMQDVGYALIELISPPYDRNLYPDFLGERSKMTNEIFDHFIKKDFLLLAASCPHKINRENLNDYVTRKSRAIAFMKIQPKTEHFRFFGPATHLNISFQNSKMLIKTLNIMNKLSGIFTLLSARQKLWLGEIEEYQSVREFSWYLNGKDDLGCIERVNFVPFEVESLEHFLDFALNQKVLFFEQGDSLLAPEEDFTYKELCSEKRLINDILSQNKYEVQLGEEDLNYFLKSFWYNVRIKNYKGEWVLELRIFDSQRMHISKYFMDLALHIIENIDEFASYSQEKNFDYWHSLYWDALNYGLNKEHVKQELDKFIELLEKQNFSVPTLFKNIQKNKKTQSDLICELFRESKIKNLIKELSVIDYHN